MSEVTPVGSTPTKQFDTTTENTQPTGKSYLLNEPIKDTVSFGKSIPKADVGKLQKNLARRFNLKLDFSKWGEKPVAQPSVPRDHHKVDVGVLQANLKQK